MKYWLCKQNITQWFLSISSLQKKTYFFNLFEMSENVRTHQNVKCLNFNLNKRNSFHETISEFNTRSLENLKINKRSDEKSLKHVKDYDNEALPGVILLTRTRVNMHHRIRMNLFTSLYVLWTYIRIFFKQSTHTFLFPFLFMHFNLSILVLH